MFVLHAEVDAHTQEVMSIPPPPFLLIVIDCNYLLTFTFTFTLVLGCVALSCVLSFRVVSHFLSMAILVPLVAE